MTYPCLDCTKRSVTCHSECGSYIIARTNNDAVRDARGRESQISNMMVEYTLAVTNRVKRR